MSIRSTTVVALGSAALLAACAPSNPKIGTTEITSSRMLTSYRESEAAAADLARGRPTEALARAEHATLLAPQNGWARYARAAALRGLGRTDAAVAEFRAAEARFENVDRHGQAISIYGRARALDDVGRCDEAKMAYDDFARFMSLSDPAAAAMARAYANECRPVEPVASDPAMTELVTGVMTRNYAGALEASERVGESARGSGWVDYNRAVALAGLDRIDEAVAAYRAAEGRFAAEPSAKAVAIYGRARALDGERRCVEAKKAYAEYAELVRGASPDDAAMAEKIARACGQ
ncbi:MAG: hypothetical protein KF819_40975 [Labilithrix sp.]|nr:hypothetical protein [Labilithrix sp.]